MNRRHRRNSGFAIPLAMLAIVLIFTIGTGILRVGLTGRILAARTTNEMLARTAADAGFTKAIFEMNAELTAGTFSAESLPSSTDENLLGTDATFTYTVTINSSGDYVITSTGYAGNSEKQVSATLKLDVTIIPDIYARESIELKNSAIIDWYNNDDDDENMTVVTDSITPATVDLKRSSAIEGDVAVGPGGDPDTVITIGSCASVTGDTSTLTQAYDPSPVEPPEWIDELPTQNTITGNKTISSSGKYAGVNLKNNNVLTVTGNVTLYIAGNITLNNSGEFRLAPDATLILYLGGNIEVKTSGKINNLTMIPENFKIYGQSSCRTVSLKNGSDVYAVLNVPEADVIVYNSADMYGAVIANTLVLDNSAKLYYDVSLRDEEYEEIDPRYVIRQWRE